jgi:hypothetical protein
MHRAFRLVSFVLLGYLVVSGCSKSADSPAPGKPAGDTLAHKTRNLIIVTLDGYRWQEIFQGADSALLLDGKYTSESASVLKDHFWAPTTGQRRARLMHFCWNYLASHGKWFGNRTLSNKVNVRNPYWISYPGYNEIYTGYPDPAISSNHYGENPNKNVLEFINDQKAFKGEVACFTLWNWFTDELNVKRSGLNVVAGHGIFAAKVTTGQPKAVMDHLKTLPLYTINDAEGAYDNQVYAVAKAFLMQYKPNVLYISFGNTDTYGHAGKYDSYLDDAHNIDVMLQDLWDYVQSAPAYKGNTTLFLCPDHGRGVGAEWESHGTAYEHSDETWCAVMGPDTKPLGEIDKDEQLYQYQYAASFAAFLGLDFTTVHPIGERITEFMDND